jgi:hypothetical protein
MIGNRTFRATGLTGDLKNAGTLEKAQYTATREALRTTKLYDRRQDKISLDGVETIGDSMPISQKLQMHSNRRTLHGAAPWGSLAYPRLLAAPCPL